MNDQTSEARSTDVETRAFTLTIELSNEAMQRPMDVAEALHALAGRFEALPELVDVGADGAVRDLNGNTVGHWEANGS